MFDTLTLPGHMVGIRQLTFIGLGSIGSGLFLSFYRTLAPHWSGTLHLWDPESVESRNRFNQQVLGYDIGKTKTAAMQRAANHIDSSSNITLIQHPEIVDYETKLSGFVVCAVDSMHARKSIWRAVLDNRDRIPLYIDVRMGMTGGRVYGITPSNEGHVLRYSDPKKHLYNDPAAPIQACKSEFPLRFIADIIGGHAGVRFVEFCQLEQGSPHPYMNFFEFDFKFRYANGSIGYFSSGEYWDDPVPSP